MFVCNIRKLGHEPQEEVVIADCWWYKSQKLLAKLKNDHWDFTILEMYGQNWLKKVTICHEERYKQIETEKSHYQRYL